MQIVIDIPKAMYDDIKSGKDGYSNYVHNSIRNGTPLPTGHWIVYDVHGHKACKCSECGMDAGYPCNDKYCRHCGSYNGGERI